MARSLFGRGVRVALGLMALSGAVGCGPGETDDVNEVSEPAAESTDDETLQACQENAASALRSLPALASEEAKLLKYWMLDRYVLDGGMGPLVRSGFHSKVLERAQVDECYDGIGQSSTLPPCASPSRPKVNDAYVWGLTKSAGSLYFGTISNTLCLVDASYLGLSAPHETAEFVCEFTARTPALGPPGMIIPGMPGDFRPPNLFRYDEATSVLTQLNASLDTASDALRKGTIGLRSAGALGHTVFIAGPYGRGGIAMFAFDGPTGAFLGSSVVNNPATPYTNVRQWVVAQNDLYVGVGTTAGGAILRWSGSRAPDALFRFEEVGHLPSDAANMTFHTDRRIYVTTWPSQTSPAGLYRSPKLKHGGLTAADADAADWSTPLWLATDYDPDPVVAASYGGGAIASWHGKLVFGTMHVPMTSLLAAERAYPLAQGNGVQNFLGTYRPIAIFQVAFRHGQPEVELLYGEKYLPKYDPAAQAFTIRYDAAHRTGRFVPKMGPSGFGNFFNAYTWSMAEYQGQLFIGTFDWSQVARLMSSLFTGDSTDVDPATVELMLRFLRGFNKEGADVVRLQPNGNALLESNAGMGNDRNYGIRNMIVDKGKLYLGTANPMNLDPKGGWELVKVTH